jgi:hypothetical protein
MDFWSGVFFAALRLCVNACFHAETQNRKEELVNAIRIALA